MHILRLTTSDDAPGRLAAGASAPEVVARILQEATGEDVQVTLRSPWPSEGLPALVGDWLDRYQPDIVLLKVNAFWFNYLSLPLRIERTLGRIGKPLNLLGRRIGEVPVVARSRPFRVLRRYLLRVIPGATYFTPEAVVASMESCIRVILAREGIGLVVSGPASRLNHELSPKAAAAHEARRQLVHQAMKNFCANLHVPYMGLERVPTQSEIEAIVGADGLHVGEAAAGKIAEEEASAFLRIWTESHGDVRTPA